MAIFQGETPKYLCRIKDSAGTQLDPSNATQVIEVKIWIYNAIDGSSSIAKFIYPTSPPAGWRAATLHTDGTDKRVMFILSAAETTAAKGNQNEIQIEIVFYDTEMPDNSRIEIKKGRFSEINTSQDD
jgi:hypothetical protein